MWGNDHNAGEIARPESLLSAVLATGPMYIEEITIEGFKSYAQRVVVPNFDPYFNAITGLNGSGKSNILDSICFVLGITNLSQVRQSHILLGVVVLFLRRRAYIGLLNCLVRSIRGPS